jgi:uncharacterized membrane protein
MNVWQGRFPAENTLGDRYYGTAPVDAYDPNGHGLHNMTGNVWAWTGDRFDAAYYARGPHHAPAGPERGTHRVMRGGSYLCHASYCRRYRVEELERLRESDTVRVIDALAVHNDSVGEIEVVHLSNLTKDEAIELGSKVAALIGLGIEGEEGMVAGAEAGAEAAADRASNGGSVFSDEEAWDVLEEIANDSAAALLLVEHHWAVPLRDAIARAGGFRISDGFISPLDLVEIGLLSRREAQELPAAEIAHQPA